MSRANPDITRLKIDEVSAVPRQEGQASRNSPIEAGESPVSEAVAMASPHGRVRNSTLGPRYAELRSARNKSASSSRAPSPNPSQEATAAARAPIQPTKSTSSIESAFSQRSFNDKHSGDNSSSKRLTPHNSVLELKRFFGKGRTKHEHGVKMKPPEEKKRQRPTFSLFGLGKKKGTSSSSSTPQNTEPPSPASSASQNRFGIGGSGSSSTGADSSSKHHNHHHHNHHHFRLFNHDHSGPPSPRENTPTPDAGFIVKNKPPKDLDPNFVVHGPDYEADWDPFHIFGLAPNSERLPFLESGITKYGEIGRDVGSGAGGSVRMMERPSDKKLFAVKEFRPRRANETPQKYAKHMTAEYALGAALHHENVIETIDLIKEGDKYYEVMEYGPHDFFELVMSGALSTPQINSSFKQIVNGVTYLHSMGVAHRDLKLDNCVVTDDGVVKLIDFGSAVIFKYPMSPQIHLARGILGSDPYLAPEVFLRQPYQPQCADVWSCGIIYCCTYLRRFPWKLPQKEDPSFRKFSENPANIDGQHPPQSNARKVTGPWRLLRLLPRDSRSLVASILKIDVSERATVETIQQEPWFKQIQIISVLPAPKQS